MLYDKRIEETDDGSFKAVDFNFPSSLAGFGDEMNSRLMFTEIPCAHCPLASKCGPDKVINPNKCLYLS